MGALAIRVELVLAGGRVVHRRLAPGAPGRVVASDPLALAARLAAQGAQALAITDLDGAAAGRPVHLALAVQAAQETGVDVVFRGGLRTVEDIEDAAAAGIARLVLDTAAFGDAAVLRFAVDRLGPRLAVALDAHGERVQLPGGGWIALRDGAAELAYRGVSELVYTDLSRAAALAGPNLDALAALCDAVEASVGYAGGVRGVGDIRALARLRRANLRSVTLATALYEGRLDLVEALAAATADGGGRS